MDDSFTVALDGPVASGKGTLGKRLALKFNFQFLDTGLLYRAVARKFLESGGCPAKIARAISIEDISMLGLRAVDVTRESSKVASIPEVREALFNLQREFSRRSGGAVLDGRDIGTRICPEAEIKFFLTASQGIRVRRRIKDFNGKGISLTWREVMEDVKERDQRDPAEMAEDAILIDSSKETQEQTFMKLCSIVEKTLNEMKFKGIEI